MYDHYERRIGIDQVKFDGPDETLAGRIDGVVLGTARGKPSGRWAVEAFGRVYAGLPSRLAAYSVLAHLLRAARRDAKGAWAVDGRRVAAVLAEMLPGYRTRIAT